MEHFSGIIPLEMAAKIVPEMSEADVRSAVGTPFASVTPDSVQKPTETFRGVGFTIFDFESDRDIDCVWTYCHDKRGKFEITSPTFTHVGFCEGNVTGTWREIRQA